MHTHATSKQLRSFGLIVGGIFAAIGVWPIIGRGEDPRLWACGLAVALGLPALCSPGLLQPAYRLWMAIGQVLGRINTTIILGVMFYGLFTPIRVVMRLRGKDPMCRRFEPDLETYRVVRQARPSSHMMRQF
jgi:hypothetical protein